MNDRIRLAEAMNLITDIEMPSTKGKAPFRIVYSNGTGQICDDPLDYLPDPFTDANDDYACLQHMIEKYNVRETNKILEYRLCAQYFIGAYAKGLLEKLNEGG